MDDLWMRSNGQWMYPVANPGHVMSASNGTSGAMLGAGTSHVKVENKDIDGTLTATNVRFTLLLTQIL